jgi:hypothetical protein
MIDVPVKAQLFAHEAMILHNRAASSFVEMWILDPPDRAVLVRANAHCGTPSTRKSLALRDKGEG